VLAKSLMLLATHADHRTGLARPGRRVITETWGIPYSTWHRHIRQLAKLGHVEQVILGNNRTGRSAEYRLLYVDPDATSGTPTEGGLIHVHGRPSLTGGGPTGENQAALHPPLTSYEEREWSRLSDCILARLSPDEWQRMDKSIAGFTRIVALKRTAVRAAIRAGDAAVIDELTRARAGHPAYDGARDILAAMWSRLDRLGRTWGIDILDDIAVEPPPDPATAAASLGITLRTGLTEIC
jgi:hypothetical protein